MAILSLQFFKESSDWMRKRKGIQLTGNAHRRSDPVVPGYASELLCLPSAGGATDTTGQTADAAGALARAAITADLSFRAEEERSPAQIQRTENLQLYVDWASRNLQNCDTKESG
jgi:hypothetical protein